ncbi:DNAH1, partial [Trypoxylus dichotomus]
MERDEEYNANRRGYYSEAITDLECNIKSKIQNGTFKRTKLLWQVKTEHHAPIIKELEASEKKNFLAPAERWMCYEEEKSICFPVDTFEPKVQMQYVVPPFTLPRNVAIERRRRQYQQRTIKECLDELGIKPKHIVPTKVLMEVFTGDKFGLFPKINYLPLELFDDEGYDNRTPHGWIQHGIIDGISHPIPGEAFIPISEKTIVPTNPVEPLNYLYVWTNVAVLEYIEDKNVYKILTLDGLQRTFKIPRIYLMFKAEDPMIFAQRIKFAVDLRNRTESTIRYEFYLDCMTLTGTYDIDDNTWNRIVRLATRDKRIKPIEFMAELEQQVRLNHKRALGEMEYRDRARKQPYVYNFLKIPPREKWKVPDKGQISTSMENFKSRIKYFQWMCIYVVPHTHRAIQFVVRECQKVAQMSLFTTSYGKNVTLGEFHEIQTQTTNNLIKHLKTVWINTIAFNIRMCLGDLGKGWFNINERKHEIYLNAKLMRFMELVKYLMQYALRLLVNHSASIYTQLIESPCQCCLSCEEGFEWGFDLINSPFRSSVPTIFALQLYMNDDGAYYSVDPDLFPKTLLTIYDSALALTHTIKQVHPLLLTNLKFPADLCLSSVGLLEDFVCKLRDSFMTCYQKAIIPLKAYAKEYNIHLDLFKMDVNSYVEYFKDNQNSAPEIKEEVSFQYKMKWNLEMTLPSSIIIGPFLIFTSSLREFLVNKRQEICTKLLNQFAKRMKNIIDNVLEEYKSVVIKLNEKPNSIEHIYDIRDWMETIPMTVKSLEEQAKRYLLEYEILDYFWYSLPDEDFENKWEVIGWPHKISQQIDAANEYLNEETDKFQKIQFNDEITLTEKIEQMTVQVTKMSAYTDFGASHENAIEVKRLWKHMKEAQEQGQLLNQRQKLFNMPVVPFDNLTKLIKEFEPYKNLWTTASDWIRWHEIWMDNPLINVDSDAIERNVTEMYKTILKSVRIFADMPGVQAVAARLKDEMDEFKPHIPLIQSLRSPGMRQRHWNNFEEETGIRIQWTAATTFKECLSLGIGDHTDLIVKISDMASKEYGIEHILDKMVAEWENNYLELTPYKKTGTFIVKISEDIQQLLDDHLVLTQQLSFSPFKAAFEERIDKWEEDLKVIAEVFEEWIDVQRQWMYLEPIFASEDIKTQLPVESKKYSSMERGWKRIMRNAYESPKIIEYCPDKKLWESLKDANHMLEIVQKGLAEYLEMKRSVFPRLFFLSDDELLEILSQARNPLAVQPHLRKCFENIAK